MAIRVGIGLSTNKDYAEAAVEAAREAKASLAVEKVDLAIVFATIDLAYTNLAKTLQVYLGEVPVIGCSSAALICNKGVLKQALAIMLLSFPENIYFNAACAEDVGAKTPLAAGGELGERLNFGFREVRRDLGVIFSSGVLSDTSKIIQGMQQRLGLSFPLLGAAASGYLNFSKAYIFFNQNLLSDAVCGVLFGGKLNFGFGVKHGWQPLGKPRRVTRSEENTVYEIDGKAASGLYEEYFDYRPGRLRKELKRISVFYPVGICLPGEKEYLLRNLLAIRENGSLLFQGDIPEGSEIRLMIGTKESCLAAARQAAEEAKARFHSQNLSFALVFDSISRYILLGRNAGKELEIIKAALGENIPILGLYTYGEEAPLTAINYRGKTYFHNQTVTILTIGG